MPAITALGAIGIGVGTQLLGSLFGGISRRNAQRDLARRSEKNLRETKKMWEQNIAETSDVYKEAFADMQNLPELDIDTTFQDQAFSAAKRSAERQFGRGAGEEIAADLIRQSTADAVGRGRQAGGSIADILGFVSDVETRERRQMSQVGSSAIQERNRRLEGAMGRLERAAQQRAGFYQQKEMAEFDQEYKRIARTAQFKQEAGLSLSSLRAQMGQSLINARNQVAQSQAALSASSGAMFESILGGVGSSIMNVGLMQGMSEGFGSNIFGGSTNLGAAPTTQGIGVNDSNFNIGNIGSPEIGGLLPNPYSND